MSKNELRSAACKLWRNAGRIDFVWHELDRIQEDENPQACQIMKCMRVLMDVEEDIMEIGDKIYPTTKDNDNESKTTD
ncbi:MAG: hypothetical protein K6E86_02210 [Bacteroidales bacterium]|nr:hypothetical protein [Bacteroidales bacterium]